MESPFRDIPAGTRLIETIRWDPAGQGPLRPLHLARLARSAARLGFACPLSRIEAVLAAVDGDRPQRLRLTLGAAGDIGLETGPLPPPAPVWRLAVATDLLAADDPWLAVKSTQRRRYDLQRKSLPPGIDEVIYANTKGQICEGTITNLFVETRSGDRLTPALSCGLLPGVMRAHLLANGWREAILTQADLTSARALYVANALRGLIPAQLDPVGAGATPDQLPP